MILDRIKQRLSHAMDWRFAWLDQRLSAQIDRRFDELERRLADEHARRLAAEDRLAAALAATDDHLRGEISGVLRAIASEEPRNRRELFKLRASPDYELPFTQAEPLVSITLPTIEGRHDLLTERALPSALNQTYENIEVIVVGDATGEQTRRAVESLGDPRVRFVELTHQVIAPDPRRRWLAAATMARNEAYRLAGGQWITGLDDDDALKPDAIENLLDLAQSNHVEVAYGLVERIDPDGQSTLLGSFPPRPEQSENGEPAPPWPVWHGRVDCGGLTHAGLKLFAREHVATELGIPGDFFRVERMVRAGVSFAMIDRTVYGYYASTLWEGPVHDRVA